MMTVAEAELVRRAAEKGRSASFCAPSQPLSALHSAHSSSDIDMDARAHAAAFLQAQQQQASSSPRARLKSTSSARRSQSCKVQGSRPPRVRRRESPRGSSDLAIQLDEVANAAFARCAAEQQQQQQQQQQLEDASYNPFLRKVPSCGRLVTLAPDGGASGEDAEGSPVLRRTASARRPRPQNGSSPNHSPTPTRVVRPSQKSRSTKRPSANASGGSRRGGGGGGGGGTSYLDVKPSGSNEGLDDSYLLRSFATTTKAGIINRGDSFRRRRSRSNSIQPPMEGPLCGTPPNIPSSLDLATPPQTPDHSGTTPTPQGLKVATPDSGGDSEPVSSFRMAILGATGVGKTALIHQFRTSECINAYDCNASDESEQPVSIMLNNMESEIVFVNLATPQDLQNEMSRSNPPDGWMIVYSITDKASFQRAGEDLSKLNSNALLRGRAVILVGNKCELVRSRAVSIDDGRDLACSYGGKFMEISVGMNHRCDELLVGVLNQLRLKGEMEPDDEEEAPKERSWTRNRSLMRASMKAKRVINRIMGKTEAKYKNCEDFQS